MAVDNRQNSETSATNAEPYDWFQNVVRTDLNSQRSGPDEQGAPVGADGVQARLRRLIERYQRLPSWVVIPQLFLAVAWGLSGLSHLLQGSWWNGSQVEEFLAANSGLGVEAYRFVLDTLVEPLPTVTAIVVLAMELTISALLLLSHRVTTALGMAALLNVQLILAGAVNPSLFFLVAALGIAIWRMETSASTTLLNRMTGVVVVAGIAVVAFLAPAVRGFRPGAALADPALVLILLTVLSVVAIWWINRRATTAERTMAELIDEGRPGTRRPIRPEPSLRTITLSLAAAAIIFLAGVALFDNDRGPTAETVQREAADTVAPLGTLEAPYPQGLHVSLNYNDLELNESRGWRIQILETIVDGGESARARVRLFYDRGTSPGPVRDIEFAAVGPSGTTNEASADRCGERSEPLPDDRLQVGQSAQGWICWTPAGRQPSDLVMAVEAKPAEGVLYMALRE